jgi:hypothetical protein
MSKDAKTGYIVLGVAVLATIISMGLGLIAG